MRILFYALLVKVLCKLYERILIIRTILISERSKDPTKILVRNYTSEQQKLAVQWPKDVELSPTPCGFLDIIVPFRDSLELTQRCFASVRAQKLPQVHLRIILVDNDSSDVEVEKWLASLSQQADVLILRDESPFNFSHLNNWAVQSISPQGLLLFLNNDVELQGANALSDFITSYYRAPKIGAMGCTLLYPNLRIQHLFAAVGNKVVAAHPLKGCRFNLDHQWFECDRPVAAVTGACLLVSYQAFVEVGGFDEALPTHGQDIDLCLKLQQKGYVNWVAPKVVMIHHETKSRSRQIPRGEVSYMYDKWGRALLANPYWSERFSRWSERPVLSWVEKDYPWKILVPERKL
jgi:O-antigen biosynthesis protein